MIPITEADGPQKFDDELEARLVKEGVAKYIGELGETAEQPAPAPGDDADEPASTNTAADEAPEYNEDMKLDELKEVAARYGVDASAMRKKADVIAAIEATKAEQPDDGADDEGNDKLYIPSGKCVLTAPGAGRTAYGAVSQVEQSDGEFHTYAGRRVPKYVSSAEGNSRTLTISSRPLMIPNNKNPFIVADVLTD